METIDELSKEVMNSFLQKNFPIKRLKDGKRFKRGVLNDSGFTGIKGDKYFISNKVDIDKLFVILYNVLSDVFGFNMYEINMVLLKYLNII